MFAKQQRWLSASGLHQGLLHDIVPSHLAGFPELPEDTAGSYRVNGRVHPDASFSATLKALFPTFPKLSDKERERVVFVNLPSSSRWDDGHVLFLILDPQAADRHA